MEPAQAREKIKGLTKVPIRSQLANEVIGITYGFFSPLEGFMDKADVDSVVKNMRLASGPVWSIPILFDISQKEITDLGLKVGQTVLLTYNNNPMAILEISEIFDYDMKAMCLSVYGTEEAKHPGCARTYAYKDKFLGGKVTLVNRPKINPPYDPYFIPPLEMRKKFKERGW
jgi:sulfate adenylyltransferase